MQRSLDEAERRAGEGEGAVYMRRSPGAERNDNSRVVAACKRARKRMTARDIENDNSRVPKAYNNSVFLRQS